MFKYTKNMCYITQNTYAISELCNSLHNVVHQQDDKLEKFNVQEKAEG